MATTKSSFHGKFFYYENINWKIKKVSKTFNEAKKFDAFVKKYQIPKLDILGDFVNKKPKALTKKKTKKCC
jgi:hypothetical protein